VWAQVDWSAAKITVTTEAQLKELVHWVDYGNDFSGKTITLGEDITLTSQWKPIGSEKNQFKGTFDGNSKSISDVSVSGEVQYAGIFGYVGEGGQIKNLVVNVKKIIMKNENTYAGGLIGYYASEKAIENCGVNIKDSIYTYYSAGGLVGNGGYVTITNSYATGNVSGGSYSGGLVGTANHATIRNSYATGNVLGRSSFGAGGLVGYGNATISNSYSTGNISSSGYSGGLVGYGSTVTITNSYTVGNVSGGSSSGGLVGSNGYNGYGSTYSHNATISNSYATGNISASGEQASSGGLLGYGKTTISSSYAVGKVSGGSFSGGLVGFGYATIINSYATGNISSSGNSGGLVGINKSGSDSKIENSYSSGSVKGKVIGGIVGENQGEIINCYYLAGAADMLVGKNEGGTITMTSGARTAEQMKQQSNYKDWNFKVWKISSEVNSGYPNLVLTGVVLAKDVVGIGGTFTDSRDGKKYKTVKIVLKTAPQTWMAENLSYNAEGSKCYNNKEENCRQYGRLYNWETAMKACPEGWYLPSEEEWETLRIIIGSTKLKAKSGWNDYQGESGNGTDDFGFSALPGGECSDYGFFQGVGNYSVWWSSSEDERRYSAYTRRMNYPYGYGDLRCEAGNKSCLFSVRCVMD
jgi:uncharacterized protein (TIGR02145 family)